MGRVEGVKDEDLASIEVALLDVGEEFARIYDGILRSLPRPNGVETLGSERLLELVIDLKTACEHAEYHLQRVLPCLEALVIAVGRTDDELDKQESN